MAEKESGFTIDGVVYPIPTLDSLKGREMKLLYDMSGLGVEDFVFAEDDDEAGAELQRKIRDPGFVLALMQITYQRANPNVTPARAKAAVDDSNYLQAYGEWLESMVDDSPPAQTRSENEQPDELPKIDSAAGSSTTGSTNGSDEPVRIPGTIGTMRSGTSSPESLQTT